LQYFLVDLVFFHLFWQIFVSVYLIGARSSIFLNIYCTIVYSEKSAMEILGNFCKTTNCDM
jgi:hypothetical protein